MELDAKEYMKEQLLKEIKALGFPESFGILIARNLNSERTMERMVGYLQNVKPKRAEDIADEMLAIMEDRATWIAKKETEESNRKYNEYLRSDLRESSEED
ncbi:MAG: hypothetical protein K6C69_03810 [Lachnospiraceae bacterium]|nr:hypothetical protein [Lachnospiraceae bacterium]